MEQTIFQRLFEIIAQRKEAGQSEKSYVASLLAKGTGKINRKIIEEAYEVCEAALTEDNSHLTCEVCDLLFHLFVLCGHKNIKLEQINEELERRFGLSGLEEKKNRKKA